MKQTEIAYLAGVIDSDGTIGIKRSTYAMRVTKDSSQPTFSEKICVKQVEPVAIDMLKHAFGGSRYMTKAATERAKELHTWRVTDLKAATCLKTLLPHLRIKRRQAENCLALRRTKEQSKRQRVSKGRGHQGSAPRSAILSAEMEALCAHAHTLNRVGI